MADFQTRAEEFQREDIALVAASVDDLEGAQKMIARQRLTFPVAYGLDAPTVGIQIGAFWNETKGHLHATGVILDPEGKVDHAVYSTGPIGRFTAKDAFARVKGRRDARRSG